MTDDVTSAPAPAERHSSHRVTIAIIGIAALVVLAVVVIFAMGVRHVPDFPTVAEQPDPALDGRLAITRWDDDRGWCLDIAAAGTPAERSTLFCSDDGSLPVPIEAYYGIRWDGAGNLVVITYKGGRDVALTIDPATGEVIDEQPAPDTEVPPDSSLRADGTRVDTEWHDDGRAVVTTQRPNEPKEELFAARGPDGYSFWSASWSPDGRFVLVRDSEGRVLVIDAEADEPTARVLLSGDVDTVSWYQPG